VDIFSYTFYGNTVTEWLLALGIGVGSVVLGKVLYWLSGNIVRKITAKTKTRLDDIIIDMVEEPVVFALTVAGIWYALTTLTLPAKAELWIGNATQFMVILSIAWLVTRLLDALFKEYVVPLTEQSETDFDDQILPIIRKGVKFTIWSMGIIIALNNAGYDVGALIAGLGITGLALAMAARDTVANVFGGFTIFTDRPFTLNDRIELMGFDGYIREIGVRSTRLETLAGRIVTIPNSKFSDSPVENVSAEPSRKVSVSLGLTYDMKPDQMRQAMEILQEIADAQETLEEKVAVGFSGFGEFSMDLKLIYYISSGEDIMGTNTAINLAILDRFAEAGLEMAFPTQTIHNLKAA
jgi:MscS family membrane protein